MRQIDLTWQQKCCAARCLRLTVKAVLTININIYGQNKAPGKRCHDINSSWEFHFVKPSLCLHVGYLLVVGMTEITETNKFSPLSAEILTMFYLGETCGSQICVREYPMTGSQMTVFTSYNQIHCWVDQNTMKNIISFSISLISVICFAIAFIIPTSGENRIAVAILAMATLVGNQCVAILPFTKIKDWLASSPTKDNAEKALIWIIAMEIFYLAGVQDVISGYILLAGIFSCIFAGLVILFWAIPAAQNKYYTHVAAQRQHEYETLVAPLEEQQRVIKHLSEVQRELELIHSMNEWEAKQLH